MVVSQVTPIKATGKAWMSFQVSGSGSTKNEVQHSHNHLRGSSLPQDPFPST